jgi:hypothetical protein
MPLHLLKMAVGCDSVEDLAEWQANRILRGEPLIHRTRNFPKREAEILSGGGSLYWIIKGQVRVRQRITALEAVTDGEGGRFCGIHLAPELVRTILKPARPMQGWRYLTPEDAPLDRDPAHKDETEEMPQAMVKELRSLGLM